MKLFGFAFSIFFLTTLWGRALAGESSLDNQKEFTLVEQANKGVFPVAPQTFDDFAGKTQHFFAPARQSKNNISPVAKGLYKKKRLRKKNRVFGKFPCQKVKNSKEVSS